ncbi:MAG TPA: NAD(P)H-hydrate epimerase [Verrucomicrobiae bacterium]|jgi:NAD(P)H-hydrate epimerase|nr:NAD(P)H-hydrate epimerase [Verrucomicrobiae bacterium]
MKAVSVQEMQAADRKAAEIYGIPTLLLMENAGRGIADMAAEKIRPGRITVVCGKGNNGGDGFVAARHLKNRSLEVEIVMAAAPAALKGDAAVNFQICGALKIPVRVFRGEAGLFAGTGTIVDAIFGVGLNAPVAGIPAELIGLINRAGASGAHVLAVDIPSGIHGDTGAVMGTAVKAHETGTLAAVKKGLLSGAGPSHAGKIRVIDIGIPRELLP